MVVCRGLVDAPAPEAWAVLADGYAYADWVVGTTAIRAADQDWPAVGSSIYFTVGERPLRLDDRTTVRAVEAERRLELEAHAAWLGSVRVVIELTPWGSGTLVTIDEHPLRGPYLLLDNPIANLGLSLRNRLMLRNLAQVVARRGARC